MNVRKQLIEQLHRSWSEFAPWYFATCFPRHFPLKITPWVVWKEFYYDQVGKQIIPPPSPPRACIFHFSAPSQLFQGAASSNSIAFGTISRCQNIHYVRKFSPSLGFLAATAVTWRRRSLWPSEIKVIYSKATPFHCAKCDRSITRSYILILH